MSDKKAIVNVRAHLPEDLVKEFQRLLYQFDRAHEGCHIAWVVDAKQSTHAWLDEVANDLPLPFKIEILRQEPK